MSESLTDPNSRAQCADAVLMIRPAAFDYNPETAITNSMQQRPGMVGVPAHNDLARAEFQHMVNALHGEGVRVCVVDDTPQPPKPDAIFPNNWVSFHADGTVVLYPMHAENRRRERRQDVVESAAEQAGFKITRTIDLTTHELQGRCLEGTGSLVLDHANRYAYASLSPRTHPAVVEEWAAAMGYTPGDFRRTRSFGCADLSHERAHVHRGALRWWWGPKPSRRPIASGCSSPCGPAAAKSSRSGTTRSNTSPGTCWSWEAGMKRSGIAGCW